MKYTDLNKEEIKKYEEILINKADKFWVDLYGRKEASNIDKLRLLSRQGKVQDKFQHDVIVGYFRKKGFASDGKTTIKERKKQLEDRKIKFGKKIALIRNSKIQDINSIVEKAKVKQKELEAIPNQIKDEYKIGKNNILQTLKEELEALYTQAEKQIDNEIKNVFKRFLGQVEKRQEAFSNNARDSIEELQRQLKIKMESSITTFSAELDAELTVLQYKETDDATIIKYSEEIKKINQEINELDGIFEVQKEPKKKKEEPMGLDALTVRDLKLMADNRNIQYTAQIRKADLIQLLDGE